MAVAVPFIIAALKSAAIGSALSMGVSALRGGNVGRAAGMGAMTGALGGVGGALGGTVGAGIGGAAGTYAGGAVTSQRVTPTQAVLGGVSSAAGHKLLTPKKFTPPASTMGSPSPAMGTSVPGYTPPYSMASAPSLMGPVTKAQSSMGYTNLSQVPSNIIGSTAASTAAKTMGALQDPVTKAQSAQGFTNLSQVPGMSPLTPKLPTVTPQLPALPKPGGITTETPSLMEGIGTKASEFLKSPTNVLGLASMGSSMLSKTPQFEMPSYVSDLRTKLMAGESLSPLGQQAKSSLAEILGAEPTELYPTANDEYYNAALRRTRESYAEAGKRLDSAYNLAGVYGSGEHLAEKSKLQEELARTESALYAQTEQRRFELARTEKYQAIQDSLGVDRATMDDIIGMTGLDVQTAAMVYGAQVADVTAIRESLGTLGMELMLRGKTGVQGGGLSTLLG